MGVKSKLMLGARVKNGGADNKLFAVARTKFGARRD